jgi:hypothetical protein
VKITWQHGATPHAIFRGACSVFSPLCLADDASDASSVEVARENLGDADLTVSGALASETTV